MESIAIAEKSKNIFSFNFINWVFQFKAHDEMERDNWVLSLIFLQRIKSKEEEENQGAKMFESEANQPVTEDNNEENKKDD